MRWVGLAFVVGVVALGHVRRSEACRPRPDPTLVFGVLGEGFDRAHADALPANAARPARGWQATGDLRDVASGEPLRLEPVDDDPRLTLPPDEVPPSRPVVVDAVVDLQPVREAGCGDSCGDVDPSSLTLIVEASVDDVAATGRVTYAIYLGVGEEGVREAQAPSALRLPVEEVGTQEGGTIRLRRSSFRTPPGVWAQVEAFDQAGNSSGRSEPFPVTEPAADGCQAGPRAPFAQLAWPLLALALASVRRPVGEEGRA